MQISLPGRGTGASSRMSASGTTAAGASARRAGEHVVAEIADERERVRQPVAVEIVPGEERRAAPQASIAAAKSSTWTSSGSSAPMRGAASAGVFGTKQTIRMMTPLMDQSSTTPFT